VALSVGLLVSGCSSDAATATGDSASAIPSPTPTSNNAFCPAMKQVTDLLEPNAGSTTPDQTKARYDNVSTLLAQAQQSAPPAFAEDVATFAAAIDRFSAALATVGYRLDAIFTTPGGEKLAADTSHALSPAIVEEMTGPCALDLGAPRAPN
jgi:hypothetical protein